MATTYKHKITMVNGPTAATDIHVSSLQCLTIDYIGFHVCLSQSCLYIFCIAALTCFN